MIAPDKPFDIRLETEADVSGLYNLSALAFGPGRFARSAYRVREGVAPVSALSLTAWIGGEGEGWLAGGVRFTAIAVGESEGGLLLGPLVVHPDLKGKGCGRALVTEGLTRAREAGFAFVLLVGDMPYYERFGFAPAPLSKITLPGPVNPARLLVAELRADALAGVTGQVVAHAP